MPGEAFLNLTSDDQRAVALEQEINFAQQVGIVSALPADKEQFRNPSGANPRFIQVLRNRLFRLGYLAADTESQAVDAELEAAVSLFQQEAGAISGGTLTVDGWVGQQSWQALQELFAFEPKIHLDRWMMGDDPGPALRRAIHLRLHVLGVVEAQDLIQPDPVDALLPSWLSLLEGLGLKTKGQDESQRSLIAAMFNIEKLIDDIGRKRVSIRARYGRLSDQKQDDAKKFLNCLTQIALWLLDYEDIKPDGRERDIRRRKRPRQNRYNYSPMYRSMRSFWKSTDLEIAHKKETITLLLRTLEGVAQLPDESQDPEVRRRQAEQVIEAVQKDPESVSSAWRKLGHRLWDGIKKVFGFIARLAKKVINWIVNAARQIARLAHQLASQALSYVRRAIRIFQDAVLVITSRDWPGSNQMIAMRRDADMDFLVYVNPAADRDTLMKFFIRSRELLEAFDIATRVLRILIAVGLAIAKLPAGPWGWWSTIRTLIQVHGNLTEPDEDRLAAPLPVLA